ncbi:MAG: hypothetical protein JSW60_07775 [Thermoplasmatales archaeon]|nr:MAG: hypothetical protein JSW60_07775 [Thermoplasmatales archaeon]
MKHIIPIIEILVGIAYSVPPLRLKRIPFVDTFINGEGVKMGVDYELMRARFLRVDFYLYTSVGLFIVALLVG